MKILFILIIPLILSTPVLATTTTTTIDISSISTTTTTIFNRIGNAFKSALSETIEMWEEATRKGLKILFGDIKKIFIEEFEKEKKELMEGFKNLFKKKD